MMRSWNNKSRPRGNALHSHLWRQRCSAWPDFRRWSLFFLYLLCSHKVILTCVANRIKQMRWFWLEGRATVTHADGLMPYRESWLVEVGYESLCQRQRRGGVRSNEERRFCFTLSSPSVTYQRIERCESTPYILPVHTLLYVRLSTHTHRNILYSFRVHIQRPDFCFTARLMYE